MPQGRQGASTAGAPPSPRDPSSVATRPSSAAIPPSPAYASNPRSLSQYATRTLVASPSQVQARTIGTSRRSSLIHSGIRPA